MRLCNLRQDFRLHIAALLLLSALYLILTGSTVGLATMQYDEYTDLAIATTLGQRPLSGHSFDGSQARLPMYVTAVAYRIARFFNPGLELLDMLPISRWMSILASTLAIWTTYLLGTRYFNVQVGLLAAALYALSPFVLHFGREALTQGDAFTPAAVTVTFLAFDQFYSKRSLLWLFFLSFGLALAISAKFFLLILVPILVTYQAVVSRIEPGRTLLPFSPDATAGRRLAHERRFAFTAVGSGLSVLVAVGLALGRNGQLGGASSWMNQGARLFWTLALVGILATFVMALREPGAWRVRQARPAQHAFLRHGWPVILPLTLAMVFALFPAHIFNPAILSALSERLFTLDGNTNLMTTSVASAKLYLGIIVLKLGLPFGIATCMAYLWALRNAVKDKGLLLVVVTSLYYGLMLAVLPLQQPFWLMNIYPLLVLALAAMIVRGLTFFKSSSLRLAWAGYFLFAAGWLIVGLIRVYPDFGYYGYETVGDRWLGDSSQGYAAVVVVTNDGSMEAIDWLRQNAGPGSKVVSYLDDVHIMNYLQSIQPFEFEFKQALQYADENVLSEELARADYVVARTIANGGRSAPIDAPEFAEQFANVHEIVRGRGVYRTVVIQIYQRQIGDDV